MIRQRERNVKGSQGKSEKLRNACGAKYHYSCHRFHRFLHTSHPHLSPWKRLNALRCMLIAIHFALVPLHAADQNHGVFFNAWILHGSGICSTHPAQTLRQRIIPSIGRGRAFFDRRPFGDHLFHIHRDTCGRMRLYPTPATRCRPAEKNALRLS
jgi:hypothetical protein